MPDNNKVKFGLKNFTWWPITEVTNSETGVVTTSYGTAHKIPGLVSVKFDRQTAQTIFRADDSDYYVYNGGGRTLSGPATFAEIPDDFAEWNWGDYRDAYGVFVEGNLKETRYFACAFEFQGDKNGIRHQLAKVSVARGSVGSETTPEGNTPNVQTDELTMTAVERPDTADGANPLFHTKADPLTQTAKYNTYLTSVYIPTGPNKYLLTIAEVADTEITVTKGCTELADGAIVIAGDELTISVTGGTLTVNGTAFVSGSTYTVSGSVTVVSTKSE